MKAVVFRYLLPILLGTGLLFVPLIGDFHIESAILAGIFASVFSAYRVSKTHRIKDSDTRSITDLRLTIDVLFKCYLFGLPLLIYALIDGCFTVDGLGYWIFIPIPSAFLGAGVGRVSRFFIPAKAISVSMLAILVVAVFFPLVELLSFPQVYFFNHVWGSWPGPVYDEEVVITGSFILFRTMTLCWALLLWILPVWNRSSLNKSLTVFSLLTLFFFYTNLSEAGIISPNSHIEKVLGGNKETQHFKIFYDKKFYSDTEIDYWSQKHEFYHTYISKKLNLPVQTNPKIHSYLYAHAWQKKKITGAKFTSYVPIWLSLDQTHIAKQQLQPALLHELVHIRSKSFGNALYNGSISIGLIEGLAEAVAGDASRESTLDQIVAAEKPYPSPDEMKEYLSLAGFYKKAGAISYTTMGSFVEYLLDNYPAEYFKKAYARADISEYYPVPFDSLVINWHRHLQTTHLDSTDREVSGFIFSRQSLFEKQCPHSISRELKYWDDYNFNLANRDTAVANEIIKHAYSEYPENRLFKREWLLTSLKNEEFDLVISNTEKSKSDSVLLFNLLRSDALFLSGNTSEANDLIRNVRTALENSNNPSLKYSYELRSDSLQWSYHVKRKYNELDADTSVFKKMNLANQYAQVAYNIQNQSFDHLLNFSQIIRQNPYAFDENWFNTSFELIDRLIYLNHLEEAKEWLSDWESSDIRPRYRQRLSLLSDWWSFKNNYKEP